MSVKEIRRLNEKKKSMARTNQKIADSKSLWRLTNEPRTRSYRCSSSVRLDLPVRTSKTHYLAMTQ